MSDMKVESPSFEIHFTDGTVNEYIQSKEVKYHWTVGNSGVLMVFRDVMHKLFAVSLKQDERIECFNASQWDRVYVIDEEVEVEEYTPTVADQAINEGLIEMS